MPETMARFAGVWSGVWDNTDGFCHAGCRGGVRQRLCPDHPQPWRICNPERPLPGFMRVTGKVVDGTLRFRTGAEIAPRSYRFADETLQGTYKGEAASA